MVDGDVAVEALARAGLGVGGRQALAAVVGGEHGADAGGPAAEERPPFNELDVVAHLGELGGGLCAGDAAADDHDRIVALGVAHGVRGGVRVGDGCVDDAGGLVGDRVDVVAVDPAAALPDVGDLELEAARQELLEAAGGEVGGAAGEDELSSGLATGLALSSGVHELEHPRLADAAAPVGAADHVALQARVLLEPLEVDVGERAGALAEEHERARGSDCARGRERCSFGAPLGSCGSVLLRRPARKSACGGFAAVAIHAETPSAAAGWGGAASAFGGRASIASAGQPRAQVPQPRHLSSS